MLELTDTETALIEEHFTTPADPSLYQATFDALIAYQDAVAAYVAAERERLAGHFPDRS